MKNFEIPELNINAEKEQIISDEMHGLNFVQSANT